MTDAHDPDEQTANGRHTGDQDTGDQVPNDQNTTEQDTTEQDTTEQVPHEQEPRTDALGEAMQRLEEADPGDTDEVLAAGTQAHEELQNRLRDSESS